jgi:hypothetical protein
LAPSPPLENERNTYKEGVEPSSLRGFDRNKNGETRKPPRCSKIKETPMRRELNPPPHVDMAKPPRRSKMKETPTRSVLNPPRRVDLRETRMRRVGTLPAARK